MTNIRPGPLLAINLCVVYIQKIYKNLQGILDDINEQDTSFLDCKHKHKMKRGAPPEKFGVLYCMVTCRIPWFYKQN